MHKGYIMNRILEFKRMLNRLTPILLLGLLWNPLLANDVKSVPVPTDATPMQNETFSVTVSVDMTDSPSPNDKLGSFTASLKWDTLAVSYVGNSGVASGFTGVVNDQNASSGMLIFNGANINGATGAFSLITVDFVAIGSSGYSSMVDLEYSAMASTAFADLLPVLAVRDTVLVIESPTSIDPLSSVPQEYELTQNYPNPFNPETTIEFALPQGANVSLKIYDVTGKLVKTLVDEPLSAGRFQATWDATNEYGSAVSSGIYIYRLSSGSFQQIKRMVLLK